MSAVFTFTRDALAEALTRVELRVALSGPAAGKVDAGSMADAIIRALGEDALTPGNIEP